jgi:hypothetical protein
MRGGLLEHLHFRNIEVGEVAHAVITIDFNYEEGAKGFVCSGGARLHSRRTAQREE